MGGMQAALAAARVEDRGPLVALAQGLGAQGLAIDQLEDDHKSISVITMGLTRP
jgi:hypothetical protein